MTNKEQAKQDAEKYSYVFPKGLASTMGKISMRMQMEASMLSQFLLLIGLTIMVIYMAIYNEGGVGYKIVLIFNMVCGWFLIASYLVTTYQQYVSFMGSMGYDPKEEREKVRKRGNIIKRIRLTRQEKKRRKEQQSIKIEDTPKGLEEQSIELKGGNTK